MAAAAWVPARHPGAVYSPLPGALLLPRLCLGVCASPAVLSCPAGTEPLVNEHGGECQTLALLRSRTEGTARVCVEGGGPLASRAASERMEMRSLDREVFGHAVL